jgi:hypothetical protein
MTIVARAKGIRAGFDALPNNVYQKVIWDVIDYDTHPSAAPGVSGMLVKNGGTDTPSGNIVLRETGFYRIKAQIYITTSSSLRSFYVGIRSLGTAGTTISDIAYANEEIPAGQHPSLSIDTIVKNDVANTYYDIVTQAISIPAATSLLQSGHVYTWLEIEYIGGLDSNFPNNGTADLSQVNAAIAELTARVNVLEQNPAQLPQTLTISGGTLNLGAL